MKLQSRQLHFRLAISRKQVCYLYIRKNACSTWKHVFAGESKHRADAKNYDNLIKFMGKYHKLVAVEQVKAIENRIIVVRDPVDRFYSGFINQFLMRMGSDRQTAMHKDVSDSVGKPIEELSFHDFLNGYLLVKNDEEIDGHFWSQTSHMADVEYNHIWLLRDMYESSKSLFGKKLADKYFLRKVNSSSRIVKYGTKSLYTPVGELYQRFVSEKSVPSLSGLIDKESLFLLTDYYKADVALYEKVNEKSRKRLIKNQGHVMARQQYCLIGGLPRAGTRQFTDLINQHPRCLIKGEVYPRSFQMIGKLLKAADLDHQGKYFEKAYLKSRTISAMNMVASICKGNHEPFGSDLQVLGFKSPRLEMHKTTLDIIFQNTNDQIVYYFCTRNLFDNYLSLSSTFDIQINRFLVQTKKSILGYFKLSESPKYNVRLLDLDEFIKSSYPGQWIYSSIFENGLVSVDTSPELCDEYYKSTSNRNATEAQGKLRRKEITQSEHDQLMGSSELLDLCKRFHDATGIDILSPAE